MSKPCIRLVLLLLSSSVSAALSHAADATERLVVLADGTRHAAELIGITDGKLTVKPAADAPSQVYEPATWLRWNHPSPPPPRPRVHLSDGSRWIAKEDWTGNVPIEFDTRDLTLDHELFGPVRLARRDVTCVLIKAAEEPLVARQLLAEAVATPANTDRVWLLDGDLLTGTAKHFDGSRLTMLLAGEPVEVSASRIAAVAFAQAPSQPDNVARARWAVGFEDGSVVQTFAVTATAQTLEMRGPGATTWRAASISDVVYLQALGPQITYLSDLDPVDYQHTPYFTGHWPLGRDRNLRGEMLRVAGQSYFKGLSMHAAARAVYRVPDGARRFCCDIALDAAAGQQGSVVFRVYRFDGQELLPAYESEVVRGGTAPLPVSIALEGAAAVVLVVDFADYGDELDHADWLDARFIR